MRWYRLIDIRHRHVAVEGESAAHRGGRWNARGRPAIYASETISLAILELCCHYGHPFLRQRYCVATLEIPDDLVEVIDRRTLPPNWPDLLLATRRLGSACFAAGHAAIRVPSVVHPFEDNLVIDPVHPRIVGLQHPAVVEIPVDPRIHLDDGESPT